MILDSQGWPEMKNLARVKILCDYEQIRLDSLISWQMCLMTPCLSCVCTELYVKVGAGYNLQAK